METFSAMLPIQVPTPPRIFDELSGQIGKLAPIALHECMRNFWQRSVLFRDILRQRGSQREEMLAHGMSSVLIYDSELVMRGDQLPYPVNYSLLRIIPPKGVEIDDRKRPVFVIDPRAGQGPGIGGSKQLSEIGEAFKAGHPVYFAGFTSSPLEGQRVEDVARAHTIFIDKVAELHPEALGKPFVFGNCQAGWHAMMAACMRPDVVGPMVIAGAPHSYAVREQWAILAIDERAAVEALPELLPAGATSRRAFSDFVQATATATSKLNPDGQRRLSKVLRLLTADTRRGEPTRGKGKITAERTQPIH